MPVSACVACTLHARMTPDGGHMRAGQLSARWDRSAQRPMHAAPSSVVLQALTPACSSVFALSPRRELPRRLTLPYACYLAA